MNQLQEAQGIAKLVDRLTERFPTIGRTRVEQVVEESRSIFDGNPIRDYVPVLVERTARDRLRLLVSASIPAAAVA